MKTNQSVLLKSVRRWAAMSLVAWTAAWPLHRAQGQPEQYDFRHFAGMPGGAGAVDAIGSAARFSYPYGVAVDSVGNVFVADYANHTIRKVTVAGVVTTLAGSAEALGRAVAIPSGLSNVVAIATGYSHRLARTAQGGWSVVGRTTTARRSFPALGPTRGDDSLRGAALRCGSASSPVGISLPA